MDWNMRKTACSRLAARLKPFRGLVVPETGWVRTIRNVLGMTGAQLAEKCGVSKTRILRIEQDEISGKTSLATLERAAKELGCRLVYGFVPEKDFLETLEERAQKKAEEKLSSVSHSMAMEDQKTGSKAYKDQAEYLKEELLRNNVKSLWD